MYNISQNIYNEPLDSIDPRVLYYFFENSIISNGDVNECEKVKLVKS